MLATFEKNYFFQFIRLKLEKTKNFVTLHVT